MKNPNDIYPVSDKPVLCTGKHGPHDLREVGQKVWSNGKKSCRACNRINRREAKRKRRRGSLGGGGDLSRIRLARDNALFYDSIVSYSVSRTEAELEAVRQGKPDRLGRSEAQIEADLARLREDAAERAANRASWDEALESYERKDGPRRHP